MPAKQTRIRRESGANPARLTKNVYKSIDGLKVMLYTHQRLKNISILYDSVQIFNLQILIMNSFNLFCFLTAGSITDLKYRKADNLMILTFFLIDLWLNHGNISSEELFQRVVSVMIVFAVMFPLYSAGLIGAGDVKFLMALCMMIGSSCLINAMVPITIAASVLFILMAVANRDSKNLRIPMLIPISLGVLVTLC